MQFEDLDARWRVLTEEVVTGLLQPPPPTIFGVTDLALLEWTKARMTPQPVSTYAAPVPAGNAESRSSPRVFIHCTGNPATPPDLFASSARKARANGWEVHELARGSSGHADRAARARRVAAHLRSTGIAAPTARMEICNVW